MDGQRAVLLAQLTSARTEPVDQLLARHWRLNRNGVSDEPVLVPQERYPAEAGYQVLLAVAGDPGPEARAQPVRCAALAAQSRATATML